MPVYCCLSGVRQTKLWPLSLSLWGVELFPCGTDLPRSLPAVPGFPGTAGIDVVYTDPSCFPSFALRLCREVQATGMSIQSEAMDD